MRLKHVAKATLGPPCGSHMLRTRRYHLSAAHRGPERDATLYHSSAASSSAAGSSFSICRWAESLRFRFGAAARGASVPVILMRYGYLRVPPETLFPDAWLDHFADIPQTVANSLQREKSG